MTGRHEQAAEPADLTRLFVKHANEGDAEKLAGLYEPDAVLEFPPGKETRGTLIRLMQMHSVDEEIWTRIADNLPGHCREQIAHAARYCAQIWQTFADQVERKAAANLADGST